MSLTKFYSRFNTFRNLLLAVCLLSSLQAVSALAESENTPATIVSGYMDGKASPEDLYQEGMRLFKAAEPGSGQNDAIAYLTAAGEQGHLQAQVMLGDMYGFGTGVSPSYEKAAYWFIKAAEQGNPKAQLYMGDLYAYGLGVEQDSSKALHYMRLAAENKDSSPETRALAKKRISVLSGE